MKLVNERMLVKMTWSFFCSLRLMDKMTDEVVQQSVFWGWHCDLRWEWEAGGRSAGDGEVRFGTRKEFTHVRVCVCVNESERSANRKLWWVAGCKDGGFQVLWINPQSNLWCSKEMEKRMEGRWNGWRETSVRVICDGRIAVVSWNRRFVRR